jgi:hypothetical protein
MSCNWLTSSAHRVGAAAVPWGSYERIDSRAHSLVGVAPKPDGRADRVLNGVGLAAASLLDGGTCRLDQAGISCPRPKAGHVSGKGRHGAEGGPNGAARRAQ